MVQLTVKLKQQLFNFFQGVQKYPYASSLILLGLLTFIFSLLPLPADVVERWYAAWLFPGVSSFFRPISDLIPFAWLDILVAAAILYICIAVRRRHWRRLLAVAAALYLVFFWTWGLSYHRTSLGARLSLNESRTSSAAIDDFARRAARELNQLHKDPFRMVSSDEQILADSVNRVARVVEKLDGTRWLAPARVKTSFLAGSWFRLAGIDGMFNPIVHEAIINGNVLDFERPFVISHELAHVRGYPNEGDANFVALMATLMSSNPQLRYSGWLHLWLYLRSRELDPLLEAGPRGDVQRVFERFRQDRVEFISTLQSAVLDAFLRANSVQEGVRSYARVVILAAGTQDTWEDFK